MSTHAGISTLQKGLHRGIVLAILTALLLGSNAAADTPTLKIIGGAERERSNIRAYLQVEALPCDLPEWRRHALTASLTEDVRKALRAVGYYHPTLAVSVEPTDGCFRVEVRLNPGIGVMVLSVDITASAELSEQAQYQLFLDNLPNSVGQLLEHKLYDQTRNQIEALASRFGFFDGAFTTRRLEVDTDTNDARFLLHYDAGQRYTLGDITLDDTGFDDALMAQFIQIKSGQLFDSHELIRQQQTLSDSALFRDVEVVAQRDLRDPATATVPVNISLTRRKRNMHRFGIGASTDVGPRISYSLDRRWVNQRGHTWAWDTALSPVTRTLTTRYGIPKGDAGQTRLDFQAGYLYERSDSNETDTLKTVMNKTTLIGKNWTRSLALEFIQETFRTDGEAETQSKMLLPGIRWYKMRADDPLYPRNGWRLNARIRGAFEGILADTDLTQVNLGYKSIIPLGRGRVLARTQLAFSDVDQFSKLPASLRFFAGGDNSIRGFDYESLGPKDDDGNVIGGKHLAIGSLEYEHPISAKWGIATFIDHGNAFNELNEVDWRTGAGLGARWHSPLGPIRLDIAHDIEADNGLRIHLSMGTDL